MKISFIIPVLNGEKYIRECLDHIIAEMNSDDEIIVVDNGSTDRTLDIVKQYEKVRILIHPGITIGALRNRGAEKAGGELLAFIDSDCLVCEGWRTAVEEVMQDSSIHATGSFYDIPDNAGWIEKAWWSFRELNVKDTHFLISGNFIIRKQTFFEISGFNEEMVTDEDTDISNRLISSGKRMVEVPRIRVVHLGNAKTIREFYKKEKWHAAGIIEAYRIHGLDKPLILTFVFIMSFVLFLSALPLSLLFDNSYLKLMVIIALVPLIAAVHKVVFYRNYRHFFHLMFLFGVLYFARSMVIMEFALRNLRGSQTAK
jgi:glycosyltransferase involved in cell wall biosynthesis